MTEQKPADESAESTEEATGDKPATTGHPSNPLSRPTDQIARPGFRNPANVRSKALKKKRKKKR